MAKKQEPSYSQKLKDPRWQKLRLEMMERAKWACQHCGDKESSLQVHHTHYEFKLEPWEYSPYSLRVLCEDCHIEAEWYRTWFKKHVPGSSIEVQRAIHSLIVGCSVFGDEEAEPVVEQLVKITWAIIQGKAELREEAINALRAIPQPNQEQ